MSTYDKYLYYETGEISSYNSSGLVFAHGVLAKDGHSGSPVYQDLSTGYTAIGILTEKHSQGFGLVKFSQWLYNKLNSYRTQTA